LDQIRIMYIQIGGIFRNQTMNDNEPKGALLLFSGVIALCVAFVHGRAVINDKFHGAIDAKELEVQIDSVVTGTTQAAAYMLLVN
jgi:hypothetical protein